MKLEIFPPRNHVAQKKEIKTAMPIMLRKASGGKEPPEELIKYAANDFPYYWLRSLEDIRKSF